MPDALPKTSAVALPDPMPIRPIVVPSGGRPGGPGGAPKPGESPVSGFDAHITPPGSKSLTNRTILLAALADGRSTLRAPLLDAEDSDRMLEAVQALGAQVTRSEGGDLIIEGVGGRWRVPEEGVRLHLGNAGTATRFLAAASLLASGPVTIDGDARMRERPIGELADALASLGAGVHYEGTAGYPPIRIVPPDPSPVGAVARLGPTQSGQFISALLLIGPWISGGLTLKLDGPPTSASYIRMTLGLLTRLGADVRGAEGLRIVRVASGLTPEGLADGAGPDLFRRIPGAGVAPFDLRIEPDASGATYFWAAAALCPGARCTVHGLGEDSLQGDAGFPTLLARMGARVGRPSKPPDGVRCTGPDRLDPILADMGDMPDATMTLAAVCCFAGGTSVLRGVRTLRVKETDRIEALRTELGRIGVQVESSVNGDPDVLSITPPEGGVDCSAAAPEVCFETYNDHRMAMSLALIGLRRPNVLIRNPRCVDKTYPGFWADWSRLYSH